VINAVYRDAWRKKRVSAGDDDDNDDDSGGHERNGDYFFKKKVEIFLICFVFTSFLAALLTRLFSLVSLAALILTNISVGVSSVVSVFSTLRAATTMAAVNCWRYRGVG
jgi:hypothetical protein